MAYTVDDGLTHSAAQVGELFDSIQQLANSAQSRAAAVGWRSRARGNAREVNAFIEKLLRAFAAKGPLNDFYALAVSLDPTLAGRGYRVILDRILRLFRSGARVASRELDHYLTIVDQFIGSERSMIQQ